MRKVSSNTKTFNLMWMWIMSIVHLMSQRIHTTFVNKHAKLFKNEKLTKGERYFGKNDQYALYENYEI